MAANLPDARTQLRRPIRRRLRISFALLAATAAMVGAILAAALGIATGAVVERSARADRLGDAVSGVHEALLDQQSAFRGFLLNGRESALERYDSGIVQEREQLNRLYVNASDPEMVVLVGDVASDAANWRAMRVVPLIAQVRAGEVDAARVTFESDRNRVLFDTVRSRLADLEARIEAYLDSASAQLASGRLLILVLIGIAVLVMSTALVAVMSWIMRRVAAPLDRLVRRAEELERGEGVSFAAERDDEIGTLATTLERLRQSLSQRYADAAVVAERGTILNRLSELISYASDEAAIVRAGLASLERLVPNRAGEILLVNPSFDRLTVMTAWGEKAHAEGEPLLIDKPSLCPGIRRSSVHLTRSALDALSIQCEIHPIRSGSLVCIPMVALNSVVGVLHLEREEEDAFDDEAIRIGSRVVEQVALAIANLRLVRRMEQQAMTDPLTGLANGRFFDPVLERELAAAERDGTSVGVLMIDLDKFKDFNDTYGHPAGDEALRSFARTVRGLLRQSDTVARYGGEEFVVCLRDSDLEAAAAVAEKLRLALELAPVEMGPGRFARITASFGVAASGSHGTDRMQLLHIADQALYRAKHAGRNRVESAGSSEHGAALPESDVPSVAPTNLSRRRIGRREGAGA